MDTSRLAIEVLQTLAGRFDIDLRFRTDGWNRLRPDAKWKLRILTNKNQDDRFRLVAYGITALEAAAAAAGMVTVVERQLERERESYKAVRKQARRDLIAQAHERVSARVKNGAYRNGTTISDAPDLA